MGAWWDDGGMMVLRAVESVVWMGFGILGVVLVAVFLEIVLEVLVGYRKRCWRSDVRVGCVYWWWISDCI